MIGPWIVLAFVAFALPIESLTKGNLDWFKKRIPGSTRNHFDLDDLLVVSVATNETDGYRRFARSLNVYGYKYEVRITHALSSWDRSREMRAKTRLIHLENRTEGNRRRTAQTPIDDTSMPFGSYWHFRVFLARSMGSVRHGKVEIWNTPPAVDRRSISCVKT